MLVKAAMVLGKAVKELLETGVHGRSSLCREMLLESVSVFVKAVIVLVSNAKVLVEAASALIEAVDVLI